MVANHFEYAVCDLSLTDDLLGSNSRNLKSQSGQGFQWYWVKIIKTFSRQRF
jgi:hypothetical protein